MRCLKVFFFAIACFLLFGPALAWAEYKAQKNELFFVDVPPDWTWAETSDQVQIVNPYGRTIWIDFQVYEGLDLSSGSEDFVLTMQKKRVYAMFQKGAKPVTRNERRVDGVYALQTGFLLPTRRGLWQATSIIFFKGGYLFDVYFEAPRDIIRLELERVMDSFRFEPPSPEDEESPESFLPAVRSSSKRTSDAPSVSETELRPAVGSSAPTHPQQVSGWEEGPAD